MILSLRNTDTWQYYVTLDSCPRTGGEGRKPVSERLDRSALGSQVNGNLAWTWFCSDDMRKFRSTLMKQGDGESIQYGANLI